MDHDPKTLARHLEQLGRQSRVRSSFIDELRRILETRGVSLDEDVEPYRRAIDDAVRREEQRSRAALRASESLSEVQRRIDKLGQACLVQLREIRSLRDFLRRRSGHVAEGLKARPAGDGSPGGGRPRKRLYVVPGPKEIQ
jgi:hypothetical protein